MQEPVLSSGHPEQEVYRFTWLRTFHNPISIRAEMQNERYYIIKKMANGAGGYDPGKLVVSEVKQISPAQWKQLLKKLDRSNFWRLSTNDPNINRLGTDGAEWIMEGQKSGKYHIAYRWSPGEEEYRQYRELCEYFIQLAGFSKKDLPPEYIY